MPCANVHVYCCNIVILIQRERRCPRLSASYSAFHSYDHSKFPTKMHAWFLLYLASYSRREKEKYRSSHSNCVISLEGQPRLYSFVVVAAAQWEANDAGRSKRALIFPDTVNTRYIGTGETRNAFLVRSRLPNSLGCSRQ